MRRILWNSGLFVAWLVAAMVYVTLQYTVLEFFWPTPNGVHGSFDGGLAIVGCGVLTIPVVRLWRKSESVPDRDNEPGPEVSR
jgi:hypothetical protein